MTLPAGTRLGAYEILALLGAGGMGEVYRARDTRLNRLVAIKVLPDVFAADADRLARFTREAQTLAALNHPHIAQIYGIEQHALVMELVEGEDLSALITRGPIPFAVLFQSPIPAPHLRVDQYAVARDGRRFLFIQPKRGETSVADSATIIVNWRGQGDNE